MTRRSTAASSPADGTRPDASTADEGKGERTRRAILHVAIGRFAERGYQRTSVSDIARAVGISPAAAYRYFPDKEALFLAAVDADAEGLVRLALAALHAGPLDTEGPPERALPAVLRRLADTVLGAVDRHPLVARCLLEGEPVAGARILEGEHLSHLRDEIAELLRVGQAMGVVRVDIDPHIIALGLESIVLSGLAGLVASPGPAGEDPRWEAVAAVMDAALRPPG